MKRFRVVIERVHTWEIDVDAANDLEAREYAKRIAYQRAADKVEFGSSLCSPLPMLEETRARG